MSRVLKQRASTGANGARPFAVQQYVPAGLHNLRPGDLATTGASAGLAVTPAPDPDAERLLSLQQQVTDLEKRLADKTARMQTREAEAHEKGRQEGLSQSEQFARERLEALEAALGSASATFAAVSGIAEVLALNLADAAIGKLLGPRADTGTFVPDSIKYQLDRFAGQHPVGLRVSPLDFPGTGDLEALTVLHPGITLVADPALGAGECRIALELGEVDIGLPGQLERLRESFAGWAQDHAELFRSRAEADA